MCPARCILRIDCGSESLHGFDGTIDPYYHHLELANAIAPKDRSMRHPLFRRSVSCNPLLRSLYVWSINNLFLNSATAIGVWRIIILAEAFFPTSVNKDSTYGIGFCSSAVEVNVAVVTACGPSMKAIASKYLPRLLGTSRGAGTSGYGAGTSGSRSKFPGSRLFASNKASHLGSNADDGYEMADPMGGNRVDIGASGEQFDMRKYKRGGDSPSISSGSEDGVVGIVKTTDVSVRYTSEEVTPSGEAKHSSVDSLV